MTRARRRLATWSLVVAVAALWPFIVAHEGAYRTGTQLLALVLVGLSLDVTMGWYHVPTLFQPAAAAAGAGTSAGLLGVGLPFVVALVAGVLAGGAVGLAALAPAAADPRRWLPVTSFAVAVGFALVVPRLVLRPFVRPDVAGIDLSDDRALYLLGLGLVLVTGLVVRRLRQRLAVEPSASTGIPWLRAVMLSGALAGGAGCLTGMIYQGWPSPLEFAPATAVAYLMIPLVGGGSLVGTVVGAGAFLASARVALALGWSSLALPAAAVVVAVTLGLPRLPSRPTGRR